LLKRQNARLLTELRDARDALRSQAEFMIQTEKLAALGQLTTGLLASLDSPVEETASASASLRRAVEAGGPHLREKAIAHARVIDDEVGACRLLLDRVRRFSAGECGEIAPT